MKKIVKFAALALVAMSLTVACKNSNPEEEPAKADTLNDTTKVEECAEDTTPKDTIEAAVATPAPAKKATKQEAAPQEEEKSIQVKGINSKKKPISEATDLKKGEGQSVTAKSIDEKVPAIKKRKKSAAEAFQK